MSMNLAAKSGKILINLWQTPTQITCMICVTKDGEVNKLIGDDAKRALQSYCSYVLYSQLDCDCKIVHINYIKKFLKKDNLEVYVV